MQYLRLLLEVIFAELVKLWDRPDGVISGPVPVLEDIDLEDDPDGRLLDQYGWLLHED